MITTNFNFLTMLAFTHTSVWSHCSRSVYWTPVQLVYSLIWIFRFFKATRWSNDDAVRTEGCNSLALSTHLGDSLKLKGHLKDLGPNVNIHWFVFGVSRMIECLAAVSNVKLNWFSFVDESWHKGHYVTSLHYHVMRCHLLRGLSDRRNEVSKGLGTNFKLVLECHKSKV